MPFLDPSRAGSAPDMRLDELILRDFRQITEAHLLFPDGLIGIVGENGSGKTTITEAVSICLHGLAAIREGQTKEDLIRDESDADAYLELLFTLGEHHYRVVRTIVAKGLGSRADLWRDGEPLAGPGPDAVTEKITELIGTLDEFRLSRFVRQDQLKELSNLRPTERKSTILRLMGVDAVEKGLADLRKAIADVDRNVKARQAALPNLDELATRITALNADRRRIGVEVTAAAATVVRASADALAAETVASEFDRAAERLAHSTATRTISLEAIAEASERLAELDTSDTRLAGVAERLAEAEIRLADAETHRAELSELERAAALRDSAAALVAQRKALEERLTAMRAEHTTLSGKAARADALEAERERASAEALAAEQAGALAMADRDEKYRAGTRQQDKIRSLRGTLTALAAGEKPNTCDACGQPVKDTPSYREHLTATLSELSAGLAAIVEDGKAAKAATEAAQERAAAARAAAEKATNELSIAKESAAADRVIAASIDERAAELETVIAQVAEAQSLPYDADRHDVLSAEAAAVSGLLSLVASARGELSERERNAAERERLNTRAEEHRLRLAAADAVLAQAGYDPAAHEAATGAAKAARAAATAAALEVARIDGDLRVAEVAIEAARAQERGIAAANADITAMLADRGDLKLTLEWMDRFRTTLIGRLRPALSRKASRLLTTLTDGRYSDLSLSPDYDILFGTAGALKSIKRASGGEADLLNLCLRLAVSELINETTGVGRTFMVLDEVLGSQSAKRELAIMDLLPRLTAHFGQIVMIAHKPAAQDRFGSVIELNFDEATETSSVFYPPRSGDGGANLEPAA